MSVEGEDRLLRRRQEVLDGLPKSDNVKGAVEQLLAANAALRHLPWPPPYDRTLHALHLGDARDLSWVPSSSVHLVVTSPPYWTLKQYEEAPGQLGSVPSYQDFLSQMDRVWAECLRVLVPGGRVCCVVGDVCVPRGKSSHRVVPLHADMQVRADALGFDNLTPIFWHKIANGAYESEGSGAGFYGKPYQPNAIVKNDVEYILFWRKPALGPNLDDRKGAYRTTSMVQKALSMLTKDEAQAWLRSVWSDVQGETTKAGHPAPYPVALAERLIRLFSFAGDTVLDPFAGTGTTAVAALRTGRNSISNELVSAYHAMAAERLRMECWLPPGHGAIPTLL